MTQARTDSSTINRREFLSYLLAASGVTLTAGACGGVTWLLLPRRGVREGILSTDSLPRQEGLPIWFREAFAWLTYPEDGLLALDGRCVYDRIRVRWNSTNDRFECPACGSKFWVDGVFIEGPASRDLDRFHTSVTGETLIVDTTRIITGQPRTPIIRSW